MTDGSIERKRKLSIILLQHPNLEEVASEMLKENENTSCDAFCPLKSKI